MKKQKELTEICENLRELGTLVSYQPQPEGNVSQDNMEININDIISSFDSELTDELEDTELIRGPFLDTLDIGVLNFDSPDHIMADFPHDGNSFDINATVLGGEPIGAYLVNGMSSEDFLALEDYGDSDAQIGYASDGDVVPDCIIQGNCDSLEINRDADERSLYKLNAGTTSEESTESLENPAVPEDPSLQAAISTDQATTLLAKSEPESSVVLATKGQLSTHSSLINRTRATKKLCLLKRIYIRVKPSLPSGCELVNHAGLEVRSVSNSNSTSHVSAVKSASAGNNKQVGLSLPKPKKKRRKINWHRCTSCTKKFRRESDWWKHLKNDHTLDFFTYPDKNIPTKG